jgi:WhiB family redox-sensing transcriptional regulator
MAQGQAAVAEIETGERTSFTLDKDVGLELRDQLDVPGADRIQVVGCRAVKEYLATHPLVPEAEPGLDITVLSDTSAEMSNPLTSHELLNFRPNPNGTNTRLLLFNLATCLTIEHGVKAWSVEGLQAFLGEKVRRKDNIWYTLNTLRRSGILVRPGEGLWALTPLASYKDMRETIIPEETFTPHVLTPEERAERNAELPGIIEDYILNDTEHFELTEADFKDYSLLWRGMKAAMNHPFYDRSGCRERLSIISQRISEHSKDEKKPAKISWAKPMDVLPEEVKDKARCGDSGPELFFSEQQPDVEAAKAVCRQCEAQRPCLEYALAQKPKSGVWGGEEFQKGRIVHLMRSRGRPRKEIKETEAAVAASQVAAN